MGLFYEKVKSHTKFTFTLNSCIFFISLKKKSLHKASVCWQCFKGGKGKKPQQNAELVFELIYCLWKSGFRILSLVEIELNNARDIVIYRVLIVRVKMYCSSRQATGHLFGSRREAIVASAIPSPTGGQLRGLLSLLVDCDRWKMLFNEFSSQSISRRRELSHLCLKCGNRQTLVVSFVRVTGDS